MHRVSFPMKIIETKKIPKKKPMLYQASLCLKRIAKNLREGTDWPLKNNQVDVVVGQVEPLANGFIGQDAVVQVDTVL